MKNRKTDEPLLVLVFTLIPKDEVEKKGGEQAVKESAGKVQPGDGEGEDVD